MSLNDAPPPQLAAAQANQGAQPQAGVSGYGAPATSQQLPYPGQSQQQQQPPQVGSRRLPFYLYERANVK